HGKRTGDRLVDIDSHNLRGLLMLRQCTNGSTSSSLLQEPCSQQNKQDCHCYHEHIRKTDDDIQMKPKRLSKIHFGQKVWNAIGWHFGQARHTAMLTRNP